MQTIYLNLRIKIPPYCNWCIDSHSSGEKQCYDCIESKNNRLADFRYKKSTELNNVLTYFGIPLEYH
jgi:hypothetical protein